MNTKLSFAPMISPSHTPNFAIGSFNRTSNLNRFSGLYPPYSRALPQKPNPLTNMKPPQQGLATASGIQQAMQKAGNAAQPKWLQMLCAVPFLPEKQATMGSSGASSSSSGASSAGSKGRMSTQVGSTKKPGSMLGTGDQGSSLNTQFSGNAGVMAQNQQNPAGNALAQNMQGNMPVAGMASPLSMQPQMGNPMLQQGASGSGLSTGFNLGMGSANGGGANLNTGAYGVVQPGWASLKPPPLKTAAAWFFSKLASNLPPVPGLTANQPMPPGPAGMMPPAPPGMPVMPPPNGGAPINMGMGQPSLDPATGQPLQDPTQAQAPQGQDPMAAQGGIPAPTDPMSGQPVTSPMQDPPAPTLPSNPRVMPPRPATASDHAQRGVIQSLGRDMHMADQPLNANEAQEDMKSDAMAMGSKTASALANVTRLAKPMTGGKLPVFARNWLVNLHTKQQPASTAGQLVAMVRGKLQDWQAGLGLNKGPRQEVQGLHDKAVASVRATRKAESSGTSGLAETQQQRYQRMLDPERMRMMQANGGDPNALRSRIRDVDTARSTKRLLTNMDEAAARGREDFMTAGTLGLGGAAGVAMGKEGAELLESAFEIADPISDPYGFGSRLATELGSEARSLKSTFKKQAGANAYDFHQEDCPKCGASMEGDTYTGKCNSCGVQWGTKTASRAEGFCSYPSCDQPNSGMKGHGLCRYHAVEKAAGVPLGGSASYDYHCKACDHSFDGNNGNCTICGKDRSHTKRAGLSQEEINRLASNYAHRIRKAVWADQAREKAAGGFLGKRRHDDESYSPHRSAVGESVDISYQDKPEQYAKGKDAWDSVSTYFRGHKKRVQQPNPFKGEHKAKYASCTPFAQGFFETCDENGLDLVSAVEKIGQEFGPEAHAELHDGLEKVARAKLLTGGLDAVTSFGRGLFGKAPQQLAMNSAKPVAMNASGQAVSTAGKAYGAGARVNQVAAPALNAGGTAAKWVAPQALPTAGGAFTGGLAGDDLGLGGDHTDFGLFKLNNRGMAMGAAAANPKFRQFASGKGYTRGVADLSGAAMRRAGLGSFAGSGVDSTLGAFGLNQRAVIDPNTGKPMIDPNTGEVLKETANTFGRMGAMMGAGSGALGRGAQRSLANIPKGSELAALRQPLGAIAGAEQRMAQGMNNFNKGFFDPMLGAAKAVVRKPLQWASNGAYSGGKHLAKGTQPVTKAQTAGRLAGTATFGMGGLGAGAALGSSMLQDKINSSVQEAAGNTLGEALPAIGDWADNFMHERGMLNEEGKFDPTQEFQRRGGMMGQVQNSMDKMLQSMGLDPKRLSPLQKLMLLGGAGAGGLGALSGNPALMGMGGLAAAGGMMPYLRGHNPENAQHLQTLTQGPVMGGFSGAPNTPQARDEWQHQQQMQMPIPNS